MSRSPRELAEHFADREVVVEDIALESHERETSSGFTRTTTIVKLHGDGHIGRGEDVTYDADEHAALQDDAATFPVRGEQSFGALSETLDATDLFPSGAPGRPVFRNYRRWALESAALDLALKQAGESLADAAGRQYRPVRFVMSMRLGEPSTAEPIDRWREAVPGLEFKLDATSDWTDGLVERLAASGAVVAVDLKGQYVGTLVDQPPDLELYERVLEGLPGTMVEDPALTEETRPLFDGHEARVAWDYPITGVESVRELPWEPAWINIKPSRFGSVRSLLATIAYCRERDISMFGGGQFELGVGRQHLHALASLFYPDQPNDVAPIGYNDPEPRDGLPASPLKPPSTSVGLDWIAE